MGIMAHPPEEGFHHTRRKKSGRGGLLLGLLVLAIWTPTITAGFWTYPVKLQLAPFETVAFPLEGDSRIDFDITSTQPLDVLLVDQFVNQGFLVNQQESCKSALSCHRSINLDVRDVRFAYYLVLANPTGTFNIVQGVLKADSSLRPGGRGQFGSGYSTPATKALSVMVSVCFFLVVWCCIGARIYLRCQYKRARNRAAASADGVELQSEIEIRYVIYPGEVNASWRPANEPPPTTIVPYYFGQPSSLQQPYLGGIALPPGNPPGDKMPNAF